MSGLADSVPLQVFFSKVSDLKPSGYQGYDAEILIYDATRKVIGGRDFVIPSDIREIALDPIICHEPPGSHYAACRLLSAVGRELRLLKPL